MTDTGPVELFSQEWCDQAVEIWNDVVIQHLADPDNYNYVVEWKDLDTDAVCQFKADTGKIVTWEPGKTYSDDECDFLLWAKRENWKKIGEGTLDPVGAVASKRVHLRKGPMAVVIKEADAFKRLLVAYGRIPHGVVAAVELEDGEDSNGAAYLVHMLLTQQAEADRSGRFADQARRLKPVKLSLYDTGEECAVLATTRGLRVTNDVDGRHPTSVRAASRHVLDVTQVRLAGRALITGPLRDPKFWGLLGDIASRKVVIKGLLSHYVNTMRFLWLVNVRR